jgi:hypothetical protein
MGKGYFEQINILSDFINLCILYYFVINCQLLAVNCHYLSG